MRRCSSHLEQEFHLWRCWSNREFFQESKLILACSQLMAQMGRLPHRAWMVLLIAAKGMEPRYLYLFFSGKLGWIHATMSHCQLLSALLKSSGLASQHDMTELDCLSYPVLKLLSSQKQSQKNESPAPATQKLTQKIFSLFCMWLHDPWVVLLCLLAIQVLSARSSVCKMACSHQSWFRETSINNSYTGECTWACSICTNLSGKFLCQV